MDSAFDASDALRDKIEARDRMSTALDRRLMFTLLIFYLVHTTARWLCVDGLVYQTEKGGDRRAGEDPKRSSAVVVRVSEEMALEMVGGNLFRVFARSSTGRGFGRVYNRAN